MIVRALRTSAVLAVSAALLSGQVVFSRRLYKQHAQTYQQIWSWNPSDGSLKPLTGSARNHFQPACSSDGNSIDFLSGTDLHGDGLWRFDRKTGDERKISDAKEMPVAQSTPPPVPECTNHAAWEPAKTRFACPSGQDILVYRAITKKEIARARFTDRPTPPGVIAWSPRGEWLLIETPGQNDNSTARQSDYFALDLRRMVWIAAGSGNSAMWVPGRSEILYSTPRDLMPLTPSGKHQVWTAHLTIFDPTTNRRKSLTSGVTNDIHPASCKP